MFAACLAADTSAVVWPDDAMDLIWRAASIVAGLEEFVPAEMGLPLTCAVSHNLLEIGLVPPQRVRSPALARHHSAPHRGQLTAAC
jgi:hypothetical protein